MYFKGCYFNYRKQTLVFLIFQKFYYSLLNVLAYTYFYQITHNRNIIDLEFPNFKVVPNSVKEKWFICCVFIEKYIYIYITQL